MATATRDSAVGLLAARALGPVMQGKIALPGDDAYTNARQIWNGAVQRRPALFALCETVEDVQASVRIARQYGLPLSVRGGGHDWAGRSLRDDGLVIDLTRMRRIEIDTRRAIATVGGGVRAADVIAAALPHGFVAVTGSHSTVGMAGFTLGGGYGCLSSRYGLGVDNLLGAEVVLPTGQQVVVNESENADLFWAIRGGGGNFGVVTSMRIRLHAVREVLAGTIIFPMSEATAVLQRYAELAATEPDELTTLLGIFPGPDGNPVLLMAPTWSGDVEYGTQVLEGFQRLGKPVFAQVAPMPYGEVLRSFDAHLVDGCHYTAQTRWLSDLTPQAISAFVDIGASRTAPHSFVFGYHFHGAPTRVPLEGTAFGLRREHFLIEVIAAWKPQAGDDGAAHKQWAWESSQRLAPFALPGGYPNVLGPDEREQTAAAFGDNSARLKKTKRQFDPNGIFTSAISLPD